MKSFLRYATFASTVSCMPWASSASTDPSDLAKRASSSSSPPVKPVSLTPSQYWDGDDGQWSTFQFQVGTPPQQIRLIPGTSTSTLYFIAPEGCSASNGDGSDCPQKRGGTFNPNGSSTWTSLGSYQYEGNYSQTSLLGYLAESEYGDDTVTMAWPGWDGPTLQNQIVGGLLEDSIFYVGNFGLSPRAINITTLSNTHPSPLQSLRQQNMIPSTSWAYTAGFKNSQLPTFGSVTLGGYDTTRFRPTGVNFPFGPDISRDLLVSVQAISSTAATSAGGLLPNAIDAYIDSTVPTIWLPLEACKAFEQAFNLTWSDEDSYYILSDDQHQALLSQNPTVTFTLGSSLAGGSTVDIVMPYSAFDLQLYPPIATNATNYFPLQRAANNTQYVLGRTFLQQAYVIADYDRQNFTVAQALFPQQNVQPNIVPIYPPGTNANGQSDTEVTKSSAPSGGAIAGIVIAIVVVLGLIALVLFFFLKRRSKQRRTKAEATAAAGTANTPAAPDQSQPVPGHVPSMGAAGGPPEYGAFEKAELDVTRDEMGTPLSERPPGTPSGYKDPTAGKMELAGDNRNIFEAPEEGKEKRGELDSTPALKRHEMDAGQTLSEMDGEEYAKGGKKGSNSKAGRQSGQVFELE